MLKFGFDPIFAYLEGVEVDPSKISHAISDVIKEDDPEIGTGRDDGVLVGLELEGESAILAFGPMPNACAQSA